MRLPEDLKNYTARGASPTIGESLLILALIAVGVVFTSTMDTAFAIEEETAQKKARIHRALLEPSFRPASLDECERALPNRPRPDGTISYQNGTGTPWHHRTCYYKVRS